MSRPFRRAGGAILIGLGVVAGCGESPTAPGESLAPELSISDGAHSGNPQFYFLPPVAADPHSDGPFDASLSPEVEICAWDGTGCSTTLALFTMDAGYGSEKVRVSEAEEHYVVNWRTREILDAYPLGGGETYRLRVLVDGVELGFADLHVLARGEKAKDVAAEGFIPIRSGQTLAIKFRIEEGAVAEQAPSEAVSAGASAGRTHSCAVALDGQAYCWGANHRGQLGTGTAGGTFTTPQLVSGGLTWRTVQASNVYTCGLATDDRIYCWGNNTLGELGIGSEDFSAHPAPEPVSGGLTFASLADLGSHNSSSSCAVTASGDLYCWGLNDRGQLGTGAVTYVESSPRLVTGGHSFSGPVSLGRSVTCGLTAAAEILCWGLNDYGQLGRGYTSAFSSPDPSPGFVQSDLTFETVSVGATHVCAIDGSGTSWCWGRNDDGELGRGSVGGVFATPQPVTGGIAFEQLDAGWGFTCGVDAAGSGLCWGQNQYGQLGRGYTSGDQPAPGPVTGGHAFEAISSGWRHACGITTTGETYCWGLGSTGQLGAGSTASSPAPVFAVDLDPGATP